MLFAHVEPVQSLVITRGSIRAQAHLTGRGHPSLPPPPRCQLAANGEMLVLLTMAMWVQLELCLIGGAGGLVGVREGEPNNNSSRHRQCVRSPLSLSTNLPNYL